MFNFNKKTVFLISLVLIPYFILGCNNQPSTKNIKQPIVNTPYNPLKKQDNANLKKSIAPDINSTSIDLANTTIKNTNIPDFNSTIIKDTNLTTIDKNNSIINLSNTETKDKNISDTNLSNLTTANDVNLTNFDKNNSIINLSNTTIKDKNISDTNSSNSTIISDINDTIRKNKLNIQNKLIQLTQDSYISLTFRVKEQLNIPNKEVTWSSNNPSVTVDQDGYILAKEDKLGSASQAIVTATPKDGSAIINCYVTIVGWKANLSNLSIEDKPQDISDLLTAEGNQLYFTSGPSIYKSTDGMKTRQRVSDFPIAEDTPYLIKTPYSHYLRIENKIYQTNKIFSTFQEILTDTNSSSGHATEHKGLRHAFAYDMENAYIYAGEYTINSSNMHAVYRGEVSPTGLKKWRKILEFDSASDDTLNSVLHIHVVTVDPYTGTLWIGTGDADNQARLYYSTDHGKSFNLFAIGAQYYRILSMWFTKDYIYWNTDSESETQVVSRIKRTDHTNKGELTPRLTSGETKVGVKYYVYKSEENYFPVQKNTLYTEITPRKLSQNNIVYPVNDPDYNYREVVATLDNGSHWYHLWVKNSAGEDILLMNTAAEGEKRDKRARVFGFKERQNGSVDVQELLSIGTPNNGPLSHYVQTVPIFQDSDGFIYLQGRQTKDRIYKTKLNWVNQ